MPAFDFAQTTRSKGVNPKAVADTWTIGPQCRGARALLVVRENRLNYADSAEAKYGRLVGVDRKWLADFPDGAHDRSATWAHKDLAAQIDH